MMCPVGYDLRTSARTGNGQKYEPLDVEDCSHGLRDARDTTDSDSLLPPKREVSSMNSTVGRETGCKLVDAHGLATDSEERASATTKLTRALAVCVIFMVLEVVGGQFAGSLAILADAAHMLSDVGGFAISLLALRASGWVATPQQTFGYFRLEVLGALVSVQIIWVMTGIILYEAFQRLYHGMNAVDGRLMFSVACVGLFLNLIMIFILGHGHCHSDAGQSHSLLSGHNHNHDHDHLDDLEDGDSHKSTCGCCTEILEHGQKKHLHHKQHEKVDDGHPVEVELVTCGTEGHIDCGGGHEHIQKPECSRSQSDGEHFLPPGEQTYSPDSLKNLNAGYPRGDLEVNYESKIALPTPRAHSAIFALRGEELCQTNYMTNSGDASLVTASESSLRSSREDVLEDENQGQGLKSSREGSLNINLRGAYLHALGDLIQNIGVLVTGLVIWFKPEWQFIDLLCSVIFSIVVIMTTTKLLKDIMWVLMESSSRDLDVEMLKSGLLQISGVSTVFDLHVWALTPGTNLLTCHIRIKPGVLAREVLHDATEYCSNLHQIKHVTIQVEDAL